MRIAARIAALLILGLSLGAAPTAGSGEAGVATRTFTARYRAVEEIVALIQPVISERGSYAVQPRIKSVTVTDAPETLKRIADLVAGFDLPPRGIVMVIQLMRAEEAPPDQPPVKKPARRMGLPPAVIQDLTKWGVITEIGSVSVPTAENGSGSVTIGAAPDDYRIQFAVGAVSPAIGVIRLERFLLEKARRGPSDLGASAAPAGAAAGPGAASRYVSLMDLVLNLKDRQTTVLGATSSQDSKQALFVSLTATAQEP